MEHDDKNAPLASEVETAPAMETRLESDPELIPRVSDWIDEDRKDEWVSYMETLHPADGARLLEHLTELRARKALAWLPADQAGEILVEVADDFRAQLLEDASKARIQALVDGLDTDDAADVLEDLPPEIVDEVLPELEDAEELQELLTYDPSTAGGIMAAQYASVRDDATIANAIDALRESADTVKELFAVYVVDQDQKLCGDLSLKDLLLSTRQTPVSSAMNAEVRSVPTNLDQEEVAAIMERYDLTSLPVVDEAQRLVGCITIDDVIDVIREEAEEDLQRLSGVSGGEEPTDSIWRIIGGRLPWLLLGLIGAGLSGVVIGSFEEALHQAVILAAFIPVIMATAGNVGIQSSSIAVQDLASGDVWEGDLLHRLGKELLVAVLNGLAVAVIMGLFILGISELVTIEEPLRLALTTAFALATVVILAATIGATVPLLLHRLKIDPALATGPFITTSNDILGVLIFFVIASVLYLA
jgi:magnesium transporter